MCCVDGLNPQHKPAARGLVEGESNIKLWISTFALLFSTFATAQPCDLTEEYMSERNQFFRDSRYSYNECISSVNVAEYWRNVADCEERGAGKNIGGGCAHVAGRIPSKLGEADFQHCQVFYLSVSEIHELWDMYVEEEGITECKSTD